MDNKIKKEVVKDVEEEAITMEEAVAMMDEAIEEDVEKEDEEEEDKEAIIDMLRAESENYKEKNETLNKVVMALLDNETAQEIQKLLQEKKDYKDEIEAKNKEIETKDKEIEELKQFITITCENISLFKKRKVDP